MFNKIPQTKVLLVASTFVNQRYIYSTHSSVNIPENGACCIRKTFNYWQQFDSFRPDVWFAESANRYVSQIMPLLTINVSLIVLGRILRTC